MFPKISFYYQHNPILEWLPIGSVICNTCPHSKFLVVPCQTQLETHIDHLVLPSHLLLSPIGMCWLLTFIAHMPN